MTTCGAPTSSAVLQAMQRVAELESVNAALRSEVVSLHKSQHDMRESMTMLSQRLLEAEIAKDVAHLAAESTVVNTEQVSLLESLRRRIHELESAVPSPLNEITLSQSDEMDNERQTAQQAMLSQVASISTDIKAKQELLDAYCKTDVEMESMRRNYEAVIVRLEEDLAKVVSCDVDAWHIVRFIGCDALCVLPTASRRTCFAGQQTQRQTSHRSHCTRTAAAGRRRKSNRGVAVRLLVTRPLQRAASLESPAFHWVLRR